jgi:hypothetical protein
MQPSTQVAHIPLIELIEPSVLFLVSVAADAFILERVIHFLLDIFLEQFS